MHPLAIENAIVVAATLLAIAGVLIASITAKQKNNQAKLDFLRSAMERGAEVNAELIDKVMHPNRTAAGRRPLRRGQGARIAGILVIAFGVGYTIFAFFIAAIASDARLPMLGVACLLGAIGIGLLVVSRVVRNDRSFSDPKE
jgi:hypothetical protein